MTLRLRSAKHLPGRQAGSYLLEALVAILIFAFGVLGLIGLLGSSIRVTNEARYRSEAANLAGGMIADMWGMTAAKIDTDFASGGAETRRLDDESSGPSARRDYAPDVAVTPGFTSESRTVVVTVYWQLPGETEKHQHVMTAQIGKNP